MNLPAGTAGNIVSVVDYTNTFQTQNLTISPNGSQKLGGVNSDFVANTEGQSLTFVYVDDTEGWKNVQDSTSNATGNPYIIATGGTTADCGNCRIHTFTGPGTFTVSKAAACAADNLVSYLVIAGGGSGGTRDRAGGGGAGGYRELVSPSSPFCGSPLNGYPNAPNRVTVTATAFPIAVGGGASANPCASDQRGNQGSTSTFSTISSAGGGAGGGCAPDTASNLNGGSGGGRGVGGIGPSPTVFAGGTGNTPPVTPPQGQNGGGGQHIGNGGSGGGGGAGAAGGNGSGSVPGTGGNGGNGVISHITGSPVIRAGGGGGLGDSGPRPGGSGGGGAGSPYPTGNGVAGTANTGGGGGGSGNNPGVGGAGGSGLVVIRYKFQG